MLAFIGPQVGRVVVLPAPSICVVGWDLNEMIPASQSQMCGSVRANKVDHQQ